MLMPDTPRNYAAMPQGCNVVNAVGIVDDKAGSTTRRPPVTDTTRAQTVPTHVIVSSMPPEWVLGYIL